MLYEQIHVGRLNKLAFKLRSLFSVSDEEHSKLAFKLHRQMFASAVNTPSRSKRIQEANLHKLKINIFGDKFCCLAPHRKCESIIASNSMQMPSSRTKHSYRVCLISYLIKLCMLLSLSDPFLVRPASFCSTPPVTSET